MSDRLASAALVRQNRADDPVVLHVQRQLANAFILHANYKRYHWQTYGPLFRDLHLLFDELATAVLGTLDELAERVRMIGQDPVAGPTEILELATVQPASLGTSMREMIEEADAHLLIVIREMRAAVGAATEREDPGSADVFTRFVQKHRPIRRGARCTFYKMGRPSGSDSVLGSISLAWTMNRSGAAPT